MQRDRGHAGDQRDEHEASPRSATRLEHQHRGGEGGDEGERRKLVHVCHEECGGGLADRIRRRPSPVDASFLDEQEEGREEQRIRLPRHQPVEGEIVRKGEDHADDHGTGGQPASGIEAEAPGETVGQEPEQRREHERDDLVVDRHQSPAIAPKDRDVELLQNEGARHGAAGGRPVYDGWLIHRAAHLETEVVEIPLAEPVGQHDVHTGGARISRQVAVSMHGQERPEEDHESDEKKDGEQGTRTIEHWSDYRGTQKACQKTDR